MEDITITIDAEHVDIVRQVVALECNSTAETLHRAAGDYSLDREYLSGFRAAAEEAHVWNGLLDALGWEANGAAGCSGTLVVPRKQLQDLFATGLQASVKRLDEEPRPIAGEWPSEVVRRRAEDIRAFEDLLDQVGWPDSEEGGRLMAAREPLTWERDALRAGMDPAEVERRRVAEERLHEAAEDAQEAIERERVWVSLLLESTPHALAEKQSRRDEHPLDARLTAFGLEVSRALRRAGAVATRATEGR